MKLKIILQAMALLTLPLFSKGQDKPSKLDAKIDSIMLKAQIDVAKLKAQIDSVKFKSQIDPSKKTEEKSVTNSEKASVFSIIVGLGAGSIMNTVYLDPVVSNANNYVIIEKADRLRYTATLGIAWTPMDYELIRSFLPGVVRRLPKGKETGPMVAIFANPLSLSSLTNSTSSFDWGAGVGFRFSGLALLGTIEFFSLRQPRDYFINQFKDNNASYIVGGDVQKEISTSDNTIFKNRGIAALGLKLVVPLDIVKKFSDNK